jgi:hypothetical protein
MIGTPIIETLDRTVPLSRDLVGARVVKVRVVFSDDHDAPELVLPIQEFRTSQKPLNRGPNCAISRDAMPAWDKFADWAGQQLLWDAKQRQKQPFIKALYEFFTASFRSGKSSGCDGSMRRVSPYMYRKIKFSLFTFTTRRTPD